MYPLVVVGAGPAGLATSYLLGRAGVRHLVLEAGEIGQTWASLYDSLVLHTGRHLSALPGMRFPRGTPLFPRRAQFLDYLRQYAAAYALSIRTHAAVVHVRRDGDWTIELAGGETIGARAIVWAAGVASEPLVPRWPGREAFPGRVCHSVEYRRPEPFAGRRVLIVGAGNSGGEIAAEIATVAASVSIAVRSGVTVVPRTIAGIPVHYLAHLTRALPRHVQQRLQATMSAIGQRLRGPSGLPAPADSSSDSASPSPSASAARSARLCRQVPLIGEHLPDAIRAGRVRVRPAMQAWTARGVRFVDGLDEEVDDVVLATGYRAALGPLGGLVTRDACGFARRNDDVISLDQPDLFFVGQTYDTRGALFNIGRDAHRVVRAILARGAYA